MNKCKCGCGRDLAEADYRYQLSGYIDATHRAAAERPKKSKRRPPGREGSPRK
jgi:hypothetical protein